MLQVVQVHQNWHGGGHTQHDDQELGTGRRGLRGAAHKVQVQDDLVKNVIFTTFKQNFMWQKKTMKKTE